MIPVTDVAKFGKFFSGDAYIVLYTEKVQNSLKFSAHLYVHQ